MLGLVVYLSTTVFLPLYFSLVAIPIALSRVFFLQEREGNVRKWTGPVQCSLFFLGCASCVAITVFILKLHHPDRLSGSLLANFPYVLLIFCAALVATTVRKIDFLVFTGCFLIEVAVGVAEYTIGVRSFFDVYAATFGETQFGDTDLLYYNRVFGLSDNSSQLAYKAIMILGIFYALRNFFRNRACLRALVIGGLIVAFYITFNRTAIITALVFSFVVLGWRQRLLFFGLSLPILIWYRNVLWEQFFRGTAGIDLSTRDVVFLRYLEFIRDNPLFGNFGVKLWIPIGDRLFHAHNSFIQLLASNGLIVSILVLLSVLVFANGRSALRIMLLFGIFSMAQYGVFWGLSAPDIMFYGLLYFVGNDGDRRNVVVGRDLALLPLLHSSHASK